MARDTTAALVVVGNEILSGKVADSNSTFLAQQLRELGVALRRIVVIPDEVDVIAATVRELAPAVDVLFTSGGVGPTHDDVTIAGVAAALGRAVVRHPAIEDMIRQYVRGPLNEAHLKMAEVVEGTELESGHLRFPTFRVENIYVLPGIPEIFREKVVALRDPGHGDVVVGRADAARGEHVIVADRGLAHGLPDVVQDIGDDRDAAQVDSEHAELPDQEHRVLLDEFSA